MSPGWSPGRLAGYFSILLLCQVRWDFLHQYLFHNCTEDYVQQPGVEL